MSHHIAFNLRAAIVAVATTVCLGPAMTSRSYASPDWPNEPAGFVAITEWSFSALTGSGWGIVNDKNLATVQSDPTAPFSPSNVGQWQYPIGFLGGGSPAIMFYDLPLPGLPQMYIGYWWKPSRPWQGHSSSGNKVQFVFTHSNALFYMIMRGITEPYTFEAVLGFPAVSNGHLPNSWGDDPGTRNLEGNRVQVSLGVWHRIEIYFKNSTNATSRNGIFRWWVDGAIAGDYTTVNFPVDLFYEFQFSPTWGGTGDIKTETDYYWFGLVRLSRPSTLSRPATPSSLTVR